MERERAEHGEDQPRVDPRGHDDQRDVFGYRVARVEHLDDHQRRQRQRGRLDLTRVEVVAPGEGVLLAARGEFTTRKALPCVALAPVGELVPRHRCVAVLGQVDAPKLGSRVPNGEDPDSRGADVEPDDEVPDQRPR